MVGRRRTADFPRPTVATCRCLLGPLLERTRRLEDLLHRPNGDCHFRKPVTISAAVSALCTLLTPNSATTSTSTSSPLQPPSPPPERPMSRLILPRRAWGSEPRSPQPLSEAEQDALRGAAGWRIPRPSSRHWCCGGALAAASASNVLHVNVEKVSLRKPMRMMVVIMANVNWICLIVSLLACSLFDDNTALVRGGAICAYGASAWVMMTRSTVSNNRALPIVRDGQITTSGLGGAFYCKGGRMSDQDSILTGNGYSDVTDSFNIPSVTCLESNFCTPCGPTNACQRRQIEQTRFYELVYVETIPTSQSRPETKPVYNLVDSVIPAEVSTEGGARLTLTGYFGETGADLRRIQVAGADCTDLVWMSRTWAECTAPALTPGLHELTVSSNLFTGLSHAVLNFKDPKSVADLAELSLTEGDLSPPFQSGVFSYKATVTSGSLHVAATPLSAGAAVTVDGEPTTIPMPLRDGNNLVTVSDLTGWQIPAAVHHLRACYSARAHASAHARASARAHANTGRANTNPDCDPDPGPGSQRECGPGWRQRGPRCRRGGPRLCCRRSGHLPHPFRIVPPLSLRPRG
ncbi:hypothetical protein PAPYR_7969 [Paratrimastix pyriformis]|uniref:IPT/TIG domain-containing protein n=1 Tax=Paratrimastix pyriformis TaxID=342808 RepID=A0ABQ8UBT1_9EUKA|nr:hypothetical protein PAPYR_7969 [Paratrimastix pyriformis]